MFGNQATCSEWPIIFFLKSEIKLTTVLNSMKIKIGHIQNQTGAATAMLWGSFHFQEAVKREQIKFKM